MVHHMYWWNLSIFCIQYIGIYFLKQIYFWWMQKKQSNSFPICFHGNAEDMLCFQELGIDPFMNSNDNISWNRHSPAVWFRCAYGLYQSQLILADKQATDRSENARCPIRDKKHRLSYFCSCLIKIITIFWKTRSFCFKGENFLIIGSILFLLSFVVENVNQKHHKWPKYMYCNPKFWWTMSSIKISLKISVTQLYFWSWPLILSLTKT